MATLEQQLSDAIAAQNALTQVVAAKKGEIDAATAAQLAAFAAWRDAAKSSFQFPYEELVVVGGDANTYYPVPLEATTDAHIGRLSISRGTGDPHPAALAGNSELLLEMSVRGYLWYGLWLSRIEFSGLYGYQTLGRIETHNIGRMFWLRGGGHQYRFQATFPMNAGSSVYGTSQLTPILTANTPIYTGHPSAPYAGNGFTVSPLSTPDARWATQNSLPMSL